MWKYPVVYIVVVLYTHDLGSFLLSDSQICPGGGICASKEPVIMALNY